MTGPRPRKESMNAVSKSASPVSAGANQATRQITESAAELSEILKEVSPVVLALSAVHMSGSLDIIRGGVKTRPPARHADQTGSLSPQDATSLRERALQIVVAWRNAQQPAPYVPTRSGLHEMVNFLFGRDIPDAYVPLVLEDMAFDAEDARVFQWKREVSEASKQSHPVVIVGAGMSGILMGYRLKQAGIPF